MGVELRTIKKVTIEDIEQHVCDSCGTIRDKDESGYFSAIDGWGFLHRRGLDQPTIFLCAACVKKAQDAVGWK